MRLGLGVIFILAFFQICLGDFEEKQQKIIEPIGFLQVKDITI